MGSCWPGDSSGPGVGRSGSLPADEPADEQPSIEAAPDEHPASAILNRLALEANRGHARFHERLSELRRVLRVRESVPHAEESPTGFAVRRFSSTVTTYTTRRREP